MDCHAQTGEWSHLRGTSYAATNSPAPVLTHKWSPGPFIPGITGLILPQLLLLFAEQWWQPYFVWGPVMAVQLVLDQSLLARLCPGPTVAATSGPGELANIDHTSL